MNWEHAETYLASMREKWNAAFPGEVREPFPIPDLTLKSRLLQIAEETPDAPYIYYRSMCITYGSVNAVAQRLAQGLLKLGVRTGDRVMICMANSPVPVILCHACFKIGAIVVCTNPLESTEDLTKKIADARPAVIAVDRHSCEHIVCALDDAGVGVLSLLYQMTEPDVKIEGYTATALTQLFLSGAQEEPDVDIDPCDTAVLQYTGGTSGVMKGCCMSHRAYIASSMAQRQAYAPALAEGEYKTLVSLPMGHGSGFTTAVTGPLMPKASIVIMDALKPSIADVLCAIKKYRPTIWPTVPLLLNRYVATPDLQKYCDLSSIRLVLSGAAPLSSKTFTWLAKRGIKVAEAYGLSEMVNIVTMSSVKEDALGRVGVPMAHIDVVLADVATGELIEDADVSGEIVVRGPSCMKEYWHDEERTRHQMENGWLYTGDMGVFDERGILRITGRKKNMVIVSGFNVYPQEVADTLCEHPDVREAWVCGVPDEERGEVCAAYIVKNEASCMTAGDLRQWCRMHMTRYKVPRVIKFAECMPVMENGKPDCGAMKQELIAHAATLDRVCEAKLLTMHCIA